MENSLPFVSLSAFKLDRSDHIKNSRLMQSFRA